jgi:hypothetical protein
MFWFLISALFFCGAIGCGSYIETDPEKTIFVPTLKIEGYEEYVEAFVADAKSFGVNLKIKDLIIETEQSVDDTPNDGATTLAKCYTGFMLTPKIVVSSEQWALLSEYGRVQLIYHELGHCILKLDHREDGLSIMNPFRIDDELFVKWNQELLEELFRGGPIRVPKSVRLNLINQHKDCEHIKK